MYHAMAQTLFIAVAPTRKVPVYIMKKFDFIKFLEAVQNYKITNLILVPPILVVRCLIFHFLIDLVFSGTIGILARMTTMNSLRH